MSDGRHISGFWGTFRSYLVAGAVLSMLAGVAGLAPALMAPMLFDAPGALDNPALWALVLTVIAFPLVCFVGPVVAYLAYRTNRRVLAAALIAGPLYLAASAVISWTILDQLCEGNPGCTGALVGSVE